MGLLSSFKPGKWEPVLANGVNDLTNKLTLIMDKFNANNERMLTKSLDEIQSSMRLMRELLDKRSQEFVVSINEFNKNVEFGIALGSTILILALVLILWCKFNESRKIGRLSERIEYLEDSLKKAKKAD